MRFPALVLSLFVSVAYPLILFFVYIALNKLVINRVEFVLYLLNFLLEFVDG